MNPWTVSIKRPDASDQIPLPVFTLPIVLMIRNLGRFLAGWPVVFRAASFSFGQEVLSRGQ